MRSTAERKVQTRVRERTNQRQAEEDSLSTPSISRRPSLQKERSSSTNTSAIIGRTSASISPDRAGPSLSGVPKAVDLDWKSLSLDHFFLDYVLRVRRIGSMPGHLDFLPEMCREQPRNSCLMEGLYAVALARIAKQSSLTHFAMQARRSYGRALTLLNAALRDTKQAKQDSTLTTVSMLSMYEIISGDKPESIWESHHAGRISLLQLRGLEQFQTPRGQSLFLAACTSLQNYYLVWRERPPPDIERWIEQLHVDSFIHYYRSTQYTHKVILACAKAQEILEDRNLNSSALQERLLQVTQELVALDQDYRGLISSLSEDYTYDTVSASKFSFREPAELSPGAPKDIHIYKDVYIAAAWNHKRRTRICLLETVLDCLNHLKISPRAETHLSVPELHFPTSPDAPRIDFQPPDIPSSTTVRQMILSLAEDVCASVPFCLGDIDADGRLSSRGSSGMALGGFLILFPLWIAGRAEMLEPEQKAWIKDRFQQISKTMGISQAQVIATGPALNGLPRTILPGDESAILRSPFSQV
ncbi:hypothetical protein MMC20_003736 [Loxospora ochrophaea]|nr:hypothetical protein [Loxospora ochrophaea]